MFLKMDLRLDRCVLTSLIQRVRSTLHLVGFRSTNLVKPPAKRDLNPLYFCVKFTNDPLDPFIYRSKTWTLLVEA